MNDKFIQIQGPFKKNIEVINLIKQTSVNFLYINKLGIQSKVGNMLKINNKIFEIGKTGIIEFNDVEINSIIFLQDESALTIIDCIVT